MYNLCLPTIKFDVEQKEFISIGTIRLEEIEDENNLKYYLQFGLKANLEQKCKEYNNLLKKHELPNRLNFLYEYL